MIYRILKLRLTRCKQTFDRNARVFQKHTKLRDLNTKKK